MKNIKINIRKIGLNVAIFLSVVAIVMVVGGGLTFAVKSIMWIMKPEGEKLQVIFTETLKKSQEETKKLCEVEKGLANLKISKFHEIKSVNPDLSDEEILKILNEKFQFNVKIEDLALLQSKTNGENLTCFTMAASVSLEPSQN